MDKNTVQISFIVDVKDIVRILLRGKEKFAASLVILNEIEREHR